MYKNTLLSLNKLNFKLLKYLFRTNISFVSFERKQMSTNKYTHADY